VKPVIGDEAPAVIADNYIGMSAYEIAYLMSNQDGAAASASLAALRLDPSEISEDVLAAAASSLVARELLVIDGENLEATGLPLAITYALASATRWTEIGLSFDERLDGAIYIEAPLFSVLCQPRMLGAWLITVQGQDARSAGVVRRLIDAQLALRPEGAVFIESKTLESASTLFVQGHDGGGWEIAAGATPTSAEIRLRPSSSDEVDSLLAALLPPQPETSAQ
jgi:hypothetical protein